VWTFLEEEEEDSLKVSSVFGEVSADGDCVVGAASETISK
jgi:hypothetical protein